MAAIAPSPTSTVKLSTELYNNVREFLTDSKEPSAADVERFIEAAVNNYLLRKASNRVEEQMAPHIAHLTEEERMAEIEDLLKEVRAGR
jgi:uncharacterized membrane protein YheB (UPF0754 family)